jgi:hypothetical protein
MGCFKVSIIGALTTIQYIAIIDKYLVHNVALTDVLDFYKSNNSCYKHVEFLQKVFFHTFFNVLYMLTPIISKSLLNILWTIVYTNSIINKLNVLDMLNTFVEFANSLRFQNINIPIPLHKLLVIWNKKYSSTIHH